ncbi:soluble starch synthase 1, chloroplastic/amyloplastic [Nymphaea colorata]|nr:soluble starch synthase 1, chloroplastic/amyloplastic [Nymphaea colorata]XP_031496036.1 soluble starch synthase 1, chloroplastic/amyloplastic [Nymphaea colorata]XP_031496037.1 soluble starch synthase 1, chloroplastic/amyloplastic [Nymphaea colorata]
MEILRLPSSVGIPGYSCSSRGQVNPSVMAFKSSICVRSFHSNVGRSLCLPGLRSYSMSGKQQGFCNSDDLEEVSLDWEEEPYDLQPPSGDEEAADPVLSEVMDMEEVLTVEVNGKASKTRTYNIIFVASEAAPYSKTGGLGDVCGSLPISLGGRGHRVMVVTPRYMNGVMDKAFAGAKLYCRIKVACFGGVHEVAFFHEYRAGVDWIFVDHPSYHRPGSPYGDKFGTFGDNQFRFTLLCHAACEAPLVLPLGGFTYGEKCLFLVNDWHASLVPILLAAKYRPHGVYRDGRCILIIHNLAHQGVEPAVTYENLGLPAEWYGALEWVFPTWARKHALDKGETVNPLKGAIVTADRVVTVSQGYAWEITTPEGGNGLDELLLSRKSVLSGITNGIDINEWDPSSDKYISCNYSVDDLSGKVSCKTALQEELQFAIRADIPLIGFIGRLDYQKGIDLIRWAMPDLLQEDIQFVMLGSGDAGTEEWMRETESAHKDKFRGWVGFSVAVSHRITAGCDILLMPSRFEPCGLNQLYAMRYGTVPVVHCTGGLRDTVENFDPFADDGEGRGTGWAFSPLSKEAMLGTLRIAIETYRDHKASWERLMKRGMKRDSSWQNAAVQYEQIFEWALMDPPYVR